MVRQFMNQIREDLRLETEKLSVTSKITIHGVLNPVQQIGTKLVFLPVPWMFSTIKIGLVAGEILTVELSENVENRQRWQKFSSE